MSNDNWQLSLPTPTTKQVWVVDYWLDDETIVSTYAMDEYTAIRMARQIRHNRPGVTGLTISKQTMFRCMSWDLNV